MAERRTGTATEQPTAERRRRARREGQVAISADLMVALGLGAVLAVLAIAAPTGVARLLAYFRGALGQAALGAGGDPDALAAAGHAAVAVAVPLALVPCAGAVLAALLFGTVQTGGLFSWSAVRPRWGRLSPRAGLRRLFGIENAGATARALLKVALVLAAGIPLLAHLWPALPRLARTNANGIVRAAGHLSLQLASRLVVALVAWGALDWVLARWRHQRALAMTRDEIRREQREREGDPQHRAERRRAHLALGRQALPHAGIGRIADFVDIGRFADFVVVGPGPAAAAVAYDRAGGRAPIVVGAGRGPAADVMVSGARGAGVPVHDDAALTQALLDTPVGDDIPEACFEAVALLLP